MEEERLYETESLSMSFVLPRTRERILMAGVVRHRTSDPGEVHYGNAIADMPCLCVDRIRFVGDAVCIVIATDPVIARLGAAAVQVEAHPLPVVTDPEAARQGLEWTDLQDNALSIERVPEGAAMVFGIELADRIDDLSAREAACCAFLSITTTRTQDTVRLEITSANPDGRPIIDALVGLSGP